MSFLKNLLGALSPEGASPAAATAGGGTETVRKIARELEALPPEQARYLAAFAYVLSRVANADLSISAEETAAMERIVAEIGDLPEDQAVLAVEIAKAQNRLFGSTENYLVTRELKETATREQCARLVDCLFAVSAADDSISSAEEAQVRQIASELGFTHAELIEMRSRWNDKRSVIKALRRGTD